MKYIYHTALVMLKIEMLICVFAIWNVNLSGYVLFVLMFILNLEVMKRMQFVYLIDRKSF